MYKYEKFFQEDEIKDVNNLVTIIKRCTIVNFNFRSKFFYRRQLKESI